MPLNRTSTEQRDMTLRTCSQVDRAYSQDQKVWGSIPSIGHV